MSAPPFLEVDHFRPAELVQSFPPDAMEILFTPIDDILPLEVAVRLLGEVEEYPDQEFLRDLSGIVEWADDELEAYQPPSQSRNSRVLADKFSSEQVGTQMDDYFETLFDIFDNHPHRSSMVVATPMYGSAPIWNKVKEHFPDKPFAAFIHGTTGTNTGGAEVKKPLAEPLVDPDTIAFFADDVSDTYVSVARFAMERHKTRVGNDHIDAKFVSLIDELQELKRQRKSFADADYQSLYQRLAQLLHEEKVVLAPVYNKNQPLFDSLREYMGTLAQDTEDPWMELQEKCMAQAVSIGEREWIMGGGIYGPLLDTGINGKGDEETKGMMDFIDPKYHEELRRLGFNKLYLRIGANIGKLVIFNPDGVEDAYDGLVEWVAGLVTQYMDFRQANEREIQVAATS